MDLNFLKTNTLDTQLQTIQSQLDECGILFQSLVNSQSEWNHTPEIVLLTLKSAGQFMQKLDKKISHNINSMSQIFSRLLDQKMNRQDLDILLAESLKRKQTDKSRSIDFKLRKQDVLDLETIQQIKSIAHAAIQDKLLNIPNTSTSTPGKQEYHNILEITQLFNKQLSKLKDSVKICQTKLLNQAVSSPEKRLNQQMTNLKNQLYEIQKNMDKKLTDRVIEISEINQKQRYYDQRVQSQRDSRLQYVMAEMDTLRRMMEEILRNKIDRKEFMDFKNKANKQIADKIKLQEVQQIVKSIQSQLENRVQEIRNQTKKFQKSISKINKQQIDDLRKAIQKLSQSKYQSSVSQKSNNTSLKSIKTSLGKIQKKISDKILDTKEDIPEMKEQISQQLKKFWKKVEGELELRDQKLCETIQESKDTLRTQYRTTRSKSKETLVNKQYQKLLNGLNNQLLHAKWISTRINANKYCVWETQLVNTMTQNFLWESNNESMVIVAAGVYRIQFGYFSPTGSYPAVFINGQLAFKKIQSHDKQVSKHSNGYMNGVTMTQLILIPPRARISIQMSKQQNGEAFFALYKL